MASPRPISFGRFHLYRRLGAGGMGEVFRAEMLGPDGFARPVVVKRMLPELTREAEAVAMFIDEARLAARLIHQNIVQVHDFGKVGNRYYLVMELVEGCDLSRLLAYFSELRRHLPLGATLIIIAALLDALNHAHQARDDQGKSIGLVHRDISPSNVLLSRAGEVKLTDFGIAKTRARLPRTTYGQLKGKIPYMSPEQAEGKPLDWRSDLFSVGVLLFQLIAGQRPFRGKSADDVLDKIRAGDYPSPMSLNSQVGPAVTAVIGKALQKRPQDRYQSGAQFREALLRAASDDGIAPDVEKLRAVVEAAAKDQEQAQQDEEETSLERPLGESSGPSNGASVVPVPGAPDPTELMLANGEAVGGGVPPYALAAPPAAAGRPRALPARTGGSGGSAGAARGSQFSTEVTRPSLFQQVFWPLIIALAASALMVTVALKYGQHSSGVAPAPAAGPPTLRVALRMFDEQRIWFRQEVFDPFEQKYGCEISIVPFEGTDKLGALLDSGAVDVAKVDVEHARSFHARGLLQDLEVLGTENLDHAGHAQFAELVQALRPEALRMGQLRSNIGEPKLYLLPRKLETLQLIYSQSWVDVAAKKFNQHRDALDKRLQEVLGKGNGLPSDFVLAADPAKWTYWDLLAAAWVWAQEPGRAQPRYTIRRGADRGVAEVLLSQAVEAGAPLKMAWALTPELIDLFLLHATMRELGLMAPATPEEIIDSKGAVERFGKGELAAYITNQIDVVFLSGNSGEKLKPAGYKVVQKFGDSSKDLKFAPLPRAAKLTHELKLTHEPAAPTRGSPHNMVLSGWGWGIPTKSRDPKLGLRLILSILSQRNHQAEVDMFPILRVRKDVEPEWSVSRAVNDLADQQFEEKDAQPLPWPEKQADLDRVIQRVNDAFLRIVWKRGYLDKTKGKPPVSRAKIAEELKRALE